MFTGLIERQGRVYANNPTEQGSRLIIDADFDTLLIGESIAVNGVCLSLVSKEASYLHFDLSPETLGLTTLGSLRAKDVVNLERAMLASSRFGGHYVSGHVDATSRVQSISKLGAYQELQLHGFEKAAMPYLISKGSITVEGVSLTINQVSKDGIGLLLIPHTLSHTSLGGLQVGQLVNIEFDYLTRIVAHQLQLAGQLKNEGATC